MFNKVYTLMSRFYNFLATFNLTPRRVVGLTSILFAWAISFGPNSIPVAGASLIILNFFGTPPLVISVAALIAGIIILARENISETVFLALCFPLISYYAVVVINVLDNGFNLGSVAFSVMAYFYILQAAETQ